MHILRAQEGEDRGGVGTRHRRCQQKGDGEGEVYGRPAHKVHTVEEAPETECRQDDAYRREYDPRAEDGAHLLELRLEAPEEEDDRQGDHPDELRLVRVVVLDPEARTAEEHPCDEEEEQGRHPKARTHLTGDDTGEHQERSYEDIWFEGYESVIHRRI